jgi:hypothetical protein
MKKQPNSRKDTRPVISFGKAKRWGRAKKA